MTENRFDRNERLFGKEGQVRIRKARIAIMGAGGLGSFAVAEAALLGFGQIDVVDHEVLSQSNCNRYLGAWHSDLESVPRKVDLAVRHIGLIDPEITATPIHANILSEAAVGALKAADYVIGCVDNDGVRFFLNKACLAYRKPLIDIASGVPEPNVFGGRVALVTGTRGCLHCLDLLDLDEVRRFFSAAELLENEAAVYGIEAVALNETGPSVVSMNGVVASLGVTALMAMVTGMDLRYTLLTYRGNRGTVSRQQTEASEQCYYCTSVRGTGDRAGLERYFAARRAVTA